MKMRTVAIIIVGVVVGIALILLVSRQTEEEIVEPPPVKLPATVVDTVNVPSLPTARPPERRIEDRRSDMMGLLSNMDVSKPVFDIMDSRKNRRARVEALRKLTRALSPDDVKALRMFLEARFDEREGLRLLAFNGLKNDVLDVLLRQNKMPQGIGSQLAGMFEDERFDDVWRDYCVQYLTIYAERAWTENPEFATGPEYAKFEETYWKALDRKDRSFSGTALIGLEMLSRDHKSLDRSKIAQKALALAGDENTLEASRITALNICSKMAVKEILPEARIIAQTGITTTLRLAAIAAIGNLGVDGDKELLGSLSNSSNKRIKQIAESALVRVASRSE